ncbi:hypothetical protein SAURM35S_00085 [Streptomyces aurantiogriseus]
MHQGVDDLVEVLQGGEAGRRGPTCTGDGCARRCRPSGGQTTTAASERPMNQTPTPVIRPVMLQPTTPIGFSPRRL